MNECMNILMIKGEGAMDGWSGIMSANGTTAFSIWFNSSGHS